VTDSASRYLFGCEALATTREMFAFSVFERIFKDYGLPRAIRTDNGVPQPQRAVRPLAPVGLVAAPRHRD
jgi:hypothetical protein